MIDTSQTQSFIQALTGDVNTPIDWRCIHDKDRARPGHNFHGALSEVLPTLTEYSNAGYGIFCCINAMDGQGQEYSNVAYIRAHVADLDDPLTSAANYQRAAQSASFAVNSSPNKYHLYWRVQPYTGNDYFTHIQRKFAQLYDADRSIVDSTRVMRVPGFPHQKNEPYNVTFTPLTEYIYSTDQLSDMLAPVNVIEHISTRSPLGTPEMQAPSLEWLKFALSITNPNDMDRQEWLSFSAAIKQAGWSHATDDELYKIWSEWCALYEGNDSGENLKLWNSIKDTETGWTTIKRRTPVEAYRMFGYTEPPAAPVTPPPTTAATDKPDSYGEILSEHECKEYFKNCYFVEREGKILNPVGRYMNSTQFNGRYGGKQFIVTSTGKTTDEPWKAALRSTCWQIPKVDHVRFLPEKPSYEIIEDGLGRPGLNTYIPAKIDAREGDVSLWLDWLQRILPVESDRKILIEYMAHCAKYPGFKIPWAPVLTSAEGIGKAAFHMIMKQSLGDVYVYTPKAQELVSSGSTFNAWMRGKLLILVNEIRIDERRELIEILKPMITDAEVEVQSKGVDQDMEDNPANWLFFSNHRDAIPVNKNGRRYAIFYSALQNAKDIENAGMDDAYFIRFFDWLRDGGGLQAVTHYLLNYPIERGALPVRAPETSSTAEALVFTQSPMERTVTDCIADGICGFKGGYVSSLAVLTRSKAAGVRNANNQTVQCCLEGMGYVKIGRAVKSYIQEDVSNRAEIYGIRSDLPLEGYGRAQGYE